MTQPRSMTAAELLDTAEVERLALQPGDVLVVKSPTLLTPDACAEMTEQLRKHFPDTKLLFLDGGLDLAVLRAEP